MRARAKKCGEHSIFRAGARKIPRNFKVACDRPISHSGCKYAISTEGGERYNWDGPSSYRLGPPVHVVASFHVGWAGATRSGGPYEFLS
jgi:hypothetical protein